MLYFILLFMNNVITYVVHFFPGRVRVPRSSFMDEALAQLLKLIKRIHVFAFHHSL